VRNGNVRMEANPPRLTVVVRVEKLTSPLLVVVLGIYCWLLRCAIFRCCEAR